jgi:4-hydroxybenzoate polyprenyltransferase
MAAPAGCLPNPFTTATFMLGAFIMRGAGCTINDLWDKDIDSKVARTKDRPIASGALTPSQGLKFFVAQMLAGAGILFSLNRFSILMGLPAVGIVLTYPLMKRFTHWPQAYLGLAMNYGIILGWTAMTGSLNPWVVLPLYGSGVAWTLVYDTIYAHQDKEDDVLVGVKSTALLFGERTKQWLTFFGVSAVGLLAFAGHQAGMGWPFQLISVGIGGLHLIWQILTLNIHDAQNCLERFKASKWFGIFVLIGVILAKLLEAPSDVVLEDAETREDSFFRVRTVGMEKQ